MDQHSLSLSISVIFQRFLTAYKSALEFRMSHYFICYLSTFQMYMGAPKLAEPIVDFWSIEVPRSTKSVVRAWNRPMHNFLKKCKKSSGKIFNRALSLM